MNYSQINVNHEKKKINKWQLRACLAILLVASFIFATDILTGVWYSMFKALVSLVLGVLLVFEGIEYGKVQTIWRSREVPNEEQQEKSKKKIEKTPVRKARNTVILTAIVALLAFINTILGFLEVLPTIFQ
jgi:uncharacterized protein YqhQ